MATVRIDPSSEEYQQFARLYAVARELYPSEVDRWNGELYATVDEGQNWGSFQPDGSFKLSKELVFDHLGPDAEPGRQVQALTSVLHEANHARVPIDAPHEPNAVPSRHSKALDEGLTEWVSINDVAVFADSAGYGELPTPRPEYSSAHHAAGELLEYAAGPEGAQQLARRAIDQPVVMRFDTIADEIVRNRLGDVVPQGPQHQQAARAELIRAMTHSEWEYLDKAQDPDLGVNAEQTTRAALDEATQGIRDHYAQDPSSPVAAPNPNFRVPQEARHELGGHQERAFSPGDRVDLAELPPPSAGSRVDRPPVGRAAGEYSGRATAGDESRFLSGSPSAAQATRFKPELGDGARGAGAPAVGQRGAERPVHPTDRGRR
jgi:hypothetical protein